jgi:hypothetical protein
MRAALQRVVRFQPGAGEDQAVVHAAPAASSYKVKYADASGGALKSVPGSRRGVGRGEPLGFQTADDGTLLAVAGDETFPLEVPAGRVHHVVWCRRVQKPRQFFVETGRAAQGTLAVSGYVAGKVAEAGVRAALHLDDDEEDDCDGDSGPWNWNGGSDDHHHSHHLGGGGGGNGGGGSGGGSSSKPPRPSGGGGGGSSFEKPVRPGSRNP